VVAWVTGLKGFLLQSGGVCLFREQLAVQTLGEGRPLGGTIVLQTDRRERRYLLERSLGDIRA
jgi:hypothetical protein